MSANKFGDGDGAKARVAHRSVQDQNSIRASLEQKRLMMLKGTQNALNGRTPTKQGKTGHIYKSKGSAKKKKIAEEDEEDDLDKFIDDEGDDSEDGLSLSDDDESPRKRKAPSRKATAAPKAQTGIRAFMISPPKAKQQTLSESSDEEDPKAENDEGEWQCKPRFVNDSPSSSNTKSPAKIMKTRISESPVKVVLKRRQIILSDSSDSDDQGVEKSVTDATSLKKVVKTAASYKKKNGQASDSELEEDDADDGNNYHNGREDTPSDDSDGEERRCHFGLAGMNQMQKDGLEFFNTASKEELLLTPRVNDKICAHLLTKRPFENWKQLVSHMGGVRSGPGVLKAYIEHLEKRGVLEKILDDCKGHSAQVAADYEKCKEAHHELKLLAPGCVLHEYQKQGVNWLVMMHEKGLNCILGDEMGLGKTIQVISFLAWCKEKNVKGPHLVIVPSSTVENWMNEIRKWCPDIKLMTYYGTQDERKQLRHMVKKKKDNIDVLLTTYNMVGSKSDDKKFFKNFKIHYVIYDEGHMLKNCATERYKGLMKIKGTRKILMTGTPLQNNLIELISLMYFTMTKVFDKYCDDITQLLGHFKQSGGRAMDSNSRQMYQKDRIDQAKAILEPYILRRLKSLVLSGLPPKTDEIVHVEMDTEQAEMYDDQLDLMREWDGNTQNAYGSLMRLRQAANHPLLMRRVYEDTQCDKIAMKLVRYEKEYEKKNHLYVAEDLKTMSDFQIHQICEKFTSTSDFLLDEDLALESGKCKHLDKVLPTIKEKGDKVLIFSQFTQVLDILEVYLRVREHSFARLDGSTPVMERQEMINDYNTDPDMFIFLLSTKAGGLGINLTSANHIIIHDIDFNPYNDKQAEDRCHRMGQKKPVHVIRLISKNTVEEGISRLAHKKLDLEKQVTIGTRGAEKEDESLGNDELKNLMSEITKAKPTSPKKRKSLTSSSS